MMCYFVRYSSLGWIGRFTAGAEARFSRGMRVICRTGRGLEVGQILAEARNGASHDAPVSEPAEESGFVLRKIAPEDDLLLARLERNKHQAIDACNAHLLARGCTSLLADAELLFDGRSLIFYFLGDPPANSEELTPRLAEIFDENTQLEQFAAKLQAGCGPECGTENSAGHGCGSSCISCVIATACGSGHKH